MDGALQTILLVEDDPNDVFFLRHAFITAGIRADLRVAQDGREAIQYLGGEGEYRDRERFPLPALVLLDLNLPVIHGMDVLHWAHSRPDMATLIVIVLTSSSNVEEVDEAYRAGARSYVVKPLTVNQRLEFVKALETYWFNFNEASGLSWRSASKSA